MRRYDVSVIGSGPAAMSAAISLARRNFNVIVFYKDGAESGKRNLGETLSGSVTRSLIELGVFPSFRKLKLVEIEGSISSWGTSQAEKTSALLHPLGIGWVFQNDAFKKILVERAISLGVTFCRDSINCVERKNGLWKICRESMSLVFTDLMIVATGRDNPGFARLPRKVPADKLVACIVILEDHCGNSSNFVTLDSSENGWFFSVKSDEVTRVLSYFTDGDLLPFRDQRGFLEMVRRHLPDLPAISRTIKHVDMSKASSFCVVSANSAFRKHFFNQGMFFCGDSAQTFDPLSSQGISAAIRGGIETADLIIEICFGYKELVIEYERNRRKRYLEYLKTWQNFYSAEKRWTGSVFWQRRRHLQHIKTFVNSVCR